MTDVTRNKYHGRRDHVQFGEDDTFDAACRAADAKRAAELQKRPDDHLDFLRQLMADDNSSLGATYYQIQQWHLAGRAASSTVEALMYQLREGGIAVLKEAPAMRRLSSLSEAQLHEVCGRLEKLKPEIARAWSAGEVVRLVEAWAKRHER